MKMHKIHAEDMGKEMAMPSKMHPSLYMDLEHVPEVKNGKVGDMYMVSMMVKHTGMDMRTGKDGKEEGNANFEIHEIGIESHKEAKKVKRYTK